MRSKHSYLLLLCFLFLGIHPSSAQDNAFDRNFFSAWHVAGFSEGGTTAPMTRTVYNDLNQEYELAKTHDTYFTFVGITYEPRFNVLNFGDRASVSVSAPLTGKIDVSFEDDIFVMGTLGAYADFNIGNLSTYNNIDGNGYALGVGMDIQKHFTGDIEGLVYSPNARLKVISLINSVYDYYFAVLLKAGIPVTYEDLNGQTAVGNQNFGLYLSLGF